VEEVIPKGREEKYPNNPHQSGDDGHQNYEYERKVLNIFVHQIFLSRKLLKILRKSGVVSLGNS
jgi:hypothetical protein